MGQDNKGRRGGEEKRKWRKKTMMQSGSCTFLLWLSNAQLFVYIIIGVIEITDSVTNVGITGI